MTARRRIPRFGRCTLLLATLASVFACPPGAAGQDPLEGMLQDRAKADIVRYHMMLDAYAAGDDVHGVEALLEWNRERIDRALGKANTRDDPFAPWPSRRYGLAAMLHTDAALRLSPDLASNEAMVHVETASRVWLLGTKLHPQVVRSAAERWYFALSRYLRHRNELYTAERLMAMGRERVPGSPTILYESGTLAECLATDYALAGATVLSPDRVHRRPDFGRTFKRRAGYLNDAARWLGEAAALDPGNDMLQVHLGRVHALRLDDEDALRILEGVRARTPDDATAYLAAVFIGGLRERQLRLDAAMEAYRSAIKRLPLGHAAYIGLSEVLQRSGRGDDARETLHSLLTESLGPTREPLWWYQFEPPSVADVRLERFRTEVRQ